MKSIFFLLLIFPLLSFSQYKTCDGKHAVKACFWQYSTYSNYAGYYLNVTNSNTSAVDVRIVSTDISVDTTVTIAANETRSLQLGYNYVAAGNPYIAGLVFTVFVLPGSSSFWVQSDDYYLTSINSEQWQKQLRKRNLLKRQPAKR